MLNADPYGSGFEILDKAIEPTLENDVRPKSYSASKKI
jgi:hypothetical protein